MKTKYKSKHENVCLKRCVLRSVSKQLRSVIMTALIFDGNLFQSLGADAINDLPPKVLLVMVLGGDSCSLAWDRSFICPNCCLTSIRSIMYRSASPWIALNAKISNWNSILKQTGKQCKENKVGVTWQNRGREQTSRAALFWIRCKLSRYAAGKPFLQGLRAFSNLVFGCRFSSAVMAVFRIFLSNVFSVFSGFFKEVSPRSGA